MTLSVVDVNHIDAGKNLGDAFPEQIFNANLWPNFAGCGGDDPAYIIRTRHATTLSYRNALQTVINAHNENDPIEAMNYDQCAQAYVREKADAWRQETEMVVDPLNVNQEKKECLDLMIEIIDAT